MSLPKPRRREDTDATIHGVAVVLITGCSSGFGMLSALEFARRDHTVYASMRDLARSGELVERADAEGLKPRLLLLDVTSDESVRAAVAQVLDEEGRIDVLVNNAFTVHLDSVEETPDERVREIFETNFFGPLRLIRATLPGMRARRSGAVVNVSSAGARLPGWPVLWLYQASKAALAKMTEGLAAEVESFGIRVALVEPGAFRTGAVATAAGERARLEAKPGSPYREIEVALARFQERVTVNGADPQIVAERIVAIATADEAPPLHNLVGDDAASFLPVYERLSEPEQAEQRRMMLERFLRMD